MLFFFFQSRSSFLAGFCGRTRVFALPVGILGPKMRVGTNTTRVHHPIDPVLDYSAVVAIFAV